MMTMAEPPRRPPYAPRPPAPPRDPRRTTGRTAPDPKRPPYASHPGYDADLPATRMPVEKAIDDAVHASVKVAVPAEVNRFWKEWEPGFTEWAKTLVAKQVEDALSTAGKAVAGQPSAPPAKVAALEEEVRRARAEAARAEASAAAAWDVANKSATARKTVNEAEQVQVETEEAPPKFRTEKWRAYVLIVGGIVSTIVLILGAVASHCGATHASTPKIPNQHEEP